MSFIRLLVIIQVQILVGDLHKGHLGSDDVIQGHQQFFFTNNSRMKKATDTGMISLCSSCQDESPDMQNDLLGSTCDLTWPWHEVKFWPQVLLTFQCHQAHVLTRLDGRNTMVLEFSCQHAYFKSYSQKTFCQKRLFWGFLTPSG